MWDNTWGSFSPWYTYSIIPATFIEKSIFSFLNYLGALVKINCSICRDVDGPRDCHTEWSKSERDKQVLCINAYMWNLEKWYRWTGLQGRNRDTNVENKHMDPKGGKLGGGWWWDELGDWDWQIYALLCIK